MNIGLYQYRPAIRLYKLAMTLKNMGYKVTVYKDKSRECVPGLYWIELNVQDIDNIGEHGRLIVFNPSLDVPAVSYPVIQYVGDIKGITESNLKEKKNLQSAQVCVFVSYTQMVHAIMMYKLNPCKCTVLYNGTIEGMLYRDKSTQRPGTAVYSGTLTDIEGHHRNIIDQLALVAKKYDLHIYPSSLGIQDAYRKIGATIHESVHPYGLISELSQYEYGFIAVSNSIVNTHMMPNKLFEYKAAGLKILWDTSTVEQKIMIQKGATYESQRSEIQTILSI